MQRLSELETLSLRALRSQTYTDTAVAPKEGGCPLESLAELRRAGNIVGLCGNWAVVTRGVPDWHLNISFIGPLNLTKAAFLDQIASNVPADEYIVVGNDPDHFGASPDKHTAASAGWRFIREDEFAAGAR